MSIESLPVEIRDEVLSYLDQDPPSHAELQQYENLEFLNSTLAPLKAVSVLSHRWRLIALQRLFRYARVCLDHQPHSICHQTKEDILGAFLEFIISCGLERNLKSLIIHTEHAWIVENLDIDQSLDSLWPLVCKMPNLRRLQIIAPPGTLGSLLALPTYMENSWAFDMPLHSFLLELPQMANQRIYPASSNILSAAPWSSLRLTEGSFIRSYSVYEYYLNIPPCLMKSGVGPLLDTLTSLSYTAVFPFFNHFRSEVLRFAIRCTQLEELSLQLVPDAESTILDDARRTSKLDVGDLWMEIDSAYGAVPGLLTRHTSLNRFSTADWRIERIPRLIRGDGVDSLKGWTEQGPGIWTRDRSVEEENISEDAILAVGSTTKPISISQESQYFGVV